MKQYHHLATRLFGVPLLIAKPKLDAILGFVGPLLGVQPDSPAPAAYGPGDKGRERKPYYITEDGVAMIEIIGPLVKRNSGDFLSGGPTTYTDLELEFTEASTDPNVKGILLLVDSPGGEFNGALELSDLIHGQRDGDKPIVAAVDGDALSAGYALASAASHLVVARSGSVGSVGVWMLHIDRSEANAKAGIKPTYISAGARKLDGNPDGPLTAEAREVFEDIVEGAYQGFVLTVARNRGMATSAVRATEAGMFFGQPKDGVPSAVAMGFADQVGTVADAMAALRSRINGVSVAKLSATNSRGKVQEQTNMNEPKVADTQNPSGAEPPSKPAPPAAEPPLSGQPGQLTLASGFEHAKSITQLCALAGLSAKQTLTFLRPDASVEQIREELLDARVSNAGRELHPHIPPHAGAMGDAFNDKEPGPVEKACEAIAAGRGGK